MSPQRVPIINPSSGVKPMLVSTALPPAVAVTLQPLPRWQVMIFDLCISFFMEATVLRATYLCDVP